MRVDTGWIGVYIRRDALTVEIAVELERLGYGTIWIGGSPPADLRLPESLLDATAQIAVGTSIVNVWRSDPRELADSYRRVAARYRGRLIIGIGVGHPEATEEYRHPYQTLVSYLDVLDEQGLPSDARVLAALGPRVLRLSARRSAGALPYLTTPEHTRAARVVLGDALLLPEQGVVIDPDPESARATARSALAPYLGMVNYTNCFQRMGFNAADISLPGSGRLVDALYPHGDAAAAAKGIRAHLEAGADHVAIQIIAGPDDDRIRTYHKLASVLGL